MSTNHRSPSFVVDQIGALESRGCKKNKDNTPDEVGTKVRSFLGSLVASQYRTLGASANTNRMYNKLQPENRMELFGSSCVVRFRIFQN